MVLTSFCATFLFLCVSFHISLLSVKCNEVQLVPCWGVWLISLIFMLGNFLPPLFWFIRGVDVLIYKKKIIEALQTRWPVLHGRYSSHPTWQRVSHEEGWQVAVQCNEGFPLCFQCGRSFTMAAVMQVSHWFILTLICHSLPLMKWGNTSPHLLMLPDACTYGAIVRHSMSAWWVSSGEIPYFSMYPFALLRPEIMLDFEWPPCCLQSVWRGPAHSGCALHSLDWTVGGDHFVRF
jgi:hypothetical protein